MKEKTPLINENELMELMAGTSSDVDAYDLDGQQGLYLPYTPDANAFREIAASMGGNSGTSFTFNSSAKDQIISDMTKSVVQGTSSYLSKKITRPAIKVKAGY